MIGSRTRGHRARSARSATIAFLVLALAAPATVATAAMSPSGENVSGGPTAFDSEFAVVVETPKGLPTHTVIRPEKVRGKLPVVVWENGGCANSNQPYRTFLERIAAAGFLVIAKAPESATTPFPWPNPLPVTSDVLWPAADTPLPPASPPFEGTMTNDGLVGPVTLMESAIDWAESENVRKGSDLFNKLDLDKIAVSGTSCGGFVAMATAVQDDRVQSVLGYNTSSTPFVIPAEQPQRQDLLELSAPIAWINGGPNDIAFPGGQADWAMPLTAPMFKAEHAYAGHDAMWISEEGQRELAEIGIYWLDLTLNGNKKAAQYVLGTSCGFCDNPYWSTEIRNWN